eukprot:CAMPEP_0183708502 /NCGR_PEP_ID=MMETSP0737-20130205/4808_1 /TAXON_ID=385413 /ORGANISM="Thalassiosira miniscula, Strain CCMP1093" /LENGTH=465 /DNA_ID=CAMNT_0025936395 /DNA_START=226 /DNA_END=1620 /DNA_ORIENTATION=-
MVTRTRSKTKNAGKSPPRPNTDTTSSQNESSNSDENKSIPSGNVTRNRGTRNRKNPQHMWKEKMEALKIFKNENGHTNVPKTEKYKQLGRFVNNQRQFYRKKLEGETNSLTDARVKALEEIGFVWSMKPISESRAKALQTQWENRIQDLVKFKEKHGHCNVPLKGEDRDLAKFVMNQRYYYKTRLEQKNSLTSQRIEDLEKIGFVWTLKGRRDGDRFLNNEEKWERNIEELKKFKDKFGHVNVAKSGEYVELGQFIGNQRYFYRRRLKGESNSLSDDRIQTLSDLGFEWKLRNKGSGSKIDNSSKMKGDSQIVEKDKEIVLPDGSSVDYATKETSQKRLVLLEDGSQILETTTKSYATKIERCTVPPECIDGVDTNPDNTDAKTPALPGGLNSWNSEKKLSYPDGSSADITTEESSKKRLIVLEGGREVLEITTTTITTKVERMSIPEETKDTSEMQSNDEHISE